MDRLLGWLIAIIVAFSRLTKKLARWGIGTYEEWEPGGQLKILLVGYNGARNTGADVRVAAIAKQVKALFGADQVRLSALTLDPETLKGYFDDDVNVITLSSVFPFQLYRICSQHHAAILCEGSTLKSTFANALTLFQCEAAGIMGAQGKPCIAYGSEVGQMDPFLVRAAKRMCKDTYFIARTARSLQALRELGLRGHRGTDAAWSYDRAIAPREADALLRQQGWDGKRPLLGIAVINPFCWPVRPSLPKWIRVGITGNHQGQYDKWFFFSDSPARREAYRRYLDQVAAGVRTFLDAHDFFPVIIGMERLDEKACRALREKLSGPSALFLSGTCSADILTGILHRLSSLVTSRYHAAVLSLEATRALPRNAALRPAPRARQAPSGTLSPPTCPFAAFPGIVV